MDSISRKNRKKRKFQQGIIYEGNANKLIKKESDDKSSINISPKEVYNSSFDKNDPESSIPESDVHEFVYFKKILDTLKSGVPDEDRALFVLNALEESKGKEIELSCHHSTSRCIESLLSFCTDVGMWRQFMTSFSNDKVTVCTNPSASHIVELLIQFALKNIKSSSSVLETNDNTSFFLTWIVEFGNFILENFTDCLENQYAAHIATSVIRALGGDMSKKLNKTKKGVSLDEASSNGTSSIEEIVLENIPKEFKEKLKLLSKLVRKIENIADYVCESYGALVVEALISILSKRIPKYCRKLIKNLASNLFDQKDNNGVPVAFLQKNTSFVIEKMFEASDEDLQSTLWTKYVDDSFEHLITHRISNFIVQRFFDSVKSTTLLQVMSEKAGSLFNNILEAEMFGIFLSVASACNRLKAHQALFMKNIMLCLQCNEPPEKQLKLVPLLLGLNKYEESEYIKTSKLTIRLHGSLLIQNLLTFQKPIKLVNSLLDVKPQVLASLACHVQGCFVITSFFKSDTIGEKSKDKLAQCLQPVATTISCDENGNLTLARVWVLLSLKQKSFIASELAKNEEKLRSHKTGNVIFNKFKIFQYKRNIEQWKEFQTKFLNKKCK
ncbi:nucleolar protein 9 [Parasteatoda tepidariorum]|uniref:nucleolar protein 9 n=1 Tax=Parasteatoda tepidariorum TaxID=114398 RepID=UPI001C729877|nr:pumilio homolog 23 [Parasteatoda tepidariorum]